MTKLTVSATLVEQTILALRAGGANNCETVVFWLGQGDIVDEVYRPEQKVAIDYFHLSGKSMRSLMGHLKMGRRRILAQVHSHPGEAFHSKADDDWAVIRHQGALSLVLPRFAATTTLLNFRQQTVTFELSSGDEWRQVGTRESISVID